MNSSNKDGDCNLYSHVDEVDISVVVEVVRESETNDLNPIHPPGSTVYVFIATVSNVLDWLVAETLTKYGKLYSIVFDKISPKWGRRGVAAGVRDKFGISTGVPDFIFYSSFA